MDKKVLDSFTSRNHQNPSITIGMESQIEDRYRVMSSNFMPALTSRNSN